MSVEETEKRKKRKRRVLTQSERLLGQLKRRNPLLYDELNEYAQATGQKPTQVVEAALSHYMLRRHIVRSELSVEQLMEAWEILKDFISMSSAIFFEWSDIMFSEQYKSMLELRTEMAPPPPTPRKLEDLEEQIMKKMWRVLEPLLDWTVHSMVRAMAPYMGVKPPAELRGKKIPVTITYEKDEEETKEK